MFRCLASLTLPLVSVMLSVWLVDDREEDGEIFHVLVNNTLNVL